MKQSAEKDYSDAQVKVGYLYGCGQGVEKDRKKSNCWYQKAAINGNTTALYNLGESYELGNGVEKDEIKAFEYYKKSAEGGYSNVKFYLGYCYVNGIGTEVNKVKGSELYDEANNMQKDDDLDKVCLWYHKAVENDNKVALYKLGEFYELGQGVVKSEIRAFEFYKKSANLGFTDAQYKLVYL